MAEMRIVLEQKDITVLAIESSCDETAAAVVVNGRKVFLILLHRRLIFTNCTVVLCRKLLRASISKKLIRLLMKLLQKPERHWMTWTQSASLMVPVWLELYWWALDAAKAISYAADKPLVGVHHIEGHISANYIANPELEPPFLCLVASGGHSHLVIVRDYGEYEILGRTRDDAAGEAFDKVARAIGLGIRAVLKLTDYQKKEIRRQLNSRVLRLMGQPYDFSFSGVKSAVLNYINGCKMKGSFLLRD